MTENFDFVTDMNARKLYWNFKVYIVRIWKVQSKDNEKEIGSIEMILQDCKMYIMTNFIVFDNKTISKNGVSRMVLTFSHRTMVNHVDNPSFSLEAFRLRSFSDLLTEDRLEHSEMFDLIGKVVGKKDPRNLITSKGLMTKRMVVILEDLGNNKMSCTLFGQLVDHILPHLDDGRVEPLIVVLKYFKATRLLSGGPSSSARISHVSSPAAWSVNDEFNRGSISVKTIEDALKSVEVLCFSYFDGKFSKTIETIYVSVKRKNDWFYKACRRCPKKVETPIGDRYKVEVMVYDGSGSINLLLWDRETTQLCGKQAHKIVLEDAVGDDDYPPFLNNMMDKVFLKINVKSANIKQYDLVYTVMKVCDDEDISLKHLPTNISSNQSAHVYEADCSNSIDVSSNVVAIISDNDPELTLDSMEECISSLKFKTPAKRAVGGSKHGLINVNNLEDEGKLSTNKFKCKGAKKLRS
ncbi:hypothetical protein AHAS_Ahas06G0132600 [Arachis hypogaea]